MRRTMMGLRTRVGQLEKLAQEHDRLIRGLRNDLLYADQEIARTHTMAERADKASTIYLPKVGEEPTITFDGYVPVNQGVAVGEVVSAMLERQCEAIVVKPKKAAKIKIRSLTGSEREVDGHC
jgi:hypothetical protein